MDKSCTSGPLISLDSWIQADFDTRMVLWKPLQIWYYLYFHTLFHLYSWNITCNWVSEIPGLEGSLFRSAEWGLITFYPSIFVFQNRHKFSFLFLKDIYHNGSRWNGIHWYLFQSLSIQWHKTKPSAPQWHKTKQSTLSLTKTLKSITSIFYSLHISI